MKYLWTICMFLICSTLWGADLSYKEKSNAGETKYERIGEVESYLSGLSSKISSMHKAMEKDFDKKLKDLERNLESKNSEELKKLDNKFSPLLEKEYALKSDNSKALARIDLFHNKIVELKETIKKLELEITTLKELAQ